MRLISIITFALILCYAHGNSQTSNCPRLPDKYEWKTARDYKRDEELVLRTLQWLNKTPLNEQLLTRSNANLFVMEWICGSPSVTISIETSVLPFYDLYPDLIFPYIHGIAQCRLTKNVVCNEQKAIINGFNTVAFMIRSDEILKKSKPLQPLIKAYKKGKMEEYVASLMNKNSDK
jgi:hypothetical protein